jgi:integrase
MARKVRDAVLDSREARRRLKARGKPYFKSLDRQLCLGYRKLGHGASGTWCVRVYLGKQAYRVEKIGMADDVSDSDGRHVLNYYEAQTKAREHVMADRAGGGPLTVAKAMEAYCDWLDVNRKTGQDARIRADALINPVLGEIPVAALTADDIRKWHADLAKTSPRVRTREGLKQQYKAIDKHDEDARRRRKVTANRTLTYLRAALNMAWREGHVASNTAWARVKPFEGVTVARVRYLTVAEAKRLINACDPDFRQLVQAALQTGCRYGELAALRAHDYNADSGTIAVQQSKSGKPRHVVLTDEGVAFFRQLCAGRPGAEIMLAKANGSPWGRADQGAPMRNACERAKITPKIGFHGLRHTWASLAVMNGVPLMVIGRNLGHRDTRMVEMHYGHLAPSYIADAIRAGAPRFGFKPDKKITTLAGGR